MAIAAILGARLLATRTTPAERLQERFAAELEALSPQWKTVDWEECDVENGQYRLRAYYVTDKETYVFAVRRLHSIGMSTVQVDPRPVGWLAQALFDSTGLERFEYKGSNAQERTELKRLAQEVGGALALAAQ
ncbi:MAG TPA: hypothetical protein VGY58_00125 [Gemmataceae bacterium]|nr:hypothetical protein [Gemmataceae bacterium]